MSRNHLLELKSLSSNKNKTLEEMRWPWWPNWMFIRDTIIHLYLFCKATYLLFLIKQKTTTAGHKASRSFVTTIDPVRLFPATLTRSSGRLVGSLPKLWLPSPSRNSELFGTMSNYFHNNNINQPPTILSNKYYYYLWT